MAKILFLTSRFPFPLSKGDKLRVYFQLKYLSSDHEVHLIAIDDKAISKEEYNELTPFCKTIYCYKLPLYKRIYQLILSPFKGIPLQVAFFYNVKIAHKIKEIINKINPDYIHCHLIRTTEYIKNIKDISKSLDFMDAFGKGMERREKSEKNIFKRLLFSYEKYQLYKYEKNVFNFIDKFCIISEQDRTLIYSPKSSKIKIVANGVDFDSFYPRQEKKIYDIVFMGNMSYPPNIAAVLHLIHEIMPIIKKSKPDIKLLIAGIGAPKSILQLASDNIYIIEYFKHISDSIAMSKIMLAPMLISIGLQNKILQAMAMKVPCIASTLSNNAIKAPNFKAIIEANSPTEFATHTLDLLSDENKANNIGQNGYDFVKANYSWKKQNELLNDLIVN